MNQEICAKCGRPIKFDESPVMSFDFGRLTKRKDFGEEFTVFISNELEEDGYLCPEHSYKAAEFVFGDNKTRTQVEMAAEIIRVIEVSINDLKAENVEHKESGATSSLIGNFIINAEESLARLQEELLMEVESSGDKAAKAVLETLGWDKIEEDDTKQD